MYNNAMVMRMAITIAILKRDEKKNEKFKLVWNFS